MKAFVTSKLPQKIYEKLEKEFILSYHDSNVPLTKEQITSGIKDCEILICPLSDKIDKDIIDSAPNLKLIANYGAGYDNIDIDYAKEKDIVVTNAPAPSSAVSTAELAFALMIASARKIVQGEKNLRQGDFMGWRPTYFLGSQLKDKTLGIIGMGNIGKNLAKRALAFEMKVIYFSRNRKKGIENENLVYMSKEDVIKNSDFLSLHTAFAPQLRHMIGEKELAMMKDTAILINAARGPLVDEKALCTALEKGVIAGAALDVYEYEPKVTKGLLKLDNVVLCPHLGNATFEARLEMGQAVVANAIAYKNGKILPNKVN